MPSEVGQPKKTPGNNAQERNERQQPVSGGQLRFFNLTARFEDFVKDLNLPPRPIPADASERSLKRQDRQGG